MKYARARVCTHVHKHIFNLHIYIKLEYGGIIKWLKQCLVGCTEETPRTKVPAEVYCKIHIQREKSKGHYLSTCAVSVNPEVHRVGCIHRPMYNQRNSWELFRIKPELKWSIITVGTCYSHFSREMVWLHLLPKETITMINNSFIVHIVVYYITCTALRTLH